MAARQRARACGVLHIPDFTIGHHGNVDSRADVGNAVPIGGRAVSVRLSAGMHDQLVRARPGNGQGTFDCARIVVEAQPHLGGYRHARGHGAPYRRYDFCNQLGIVQQRSAAAVAVHHLGRAAKIKVDAVRPQGCQAGGVFSQAHRVRPQQLRAHRHTRKRAPAVEQLGHHADESAVWQQRIGDADELRHAAVHAAHTGQDVAQHKVQQALHGGKEQGHFKFAWGNWRMN